MLAAIAGGLLVAAFLPMAVAVADEYDFTPQPHTFEPTQVEGYPPLDNVVTGTESWGVSDATTGTALPGPLLSGVDTETTIGSFTNDDFIGQGTILLATNTDIVAPSGTQVDLANFGDGFENEWIDVPSGGTNPGISDLLITPFGDFPLAGSFFADLSAAF